MEAKPTRMSFIISKLLIAISLLLRLLKILTPRKSFLLWTEFESIFRLTFITSKLIFPSFLSFPRKGQGFQKRLERKPLKCSKGFLRVWPWSRSHVVIWYRQRLEADWGIHLDLGTLDLTVPHLGLVVISQVFRPKVTWPWVKLQDCSVWRLLMSAHSVPISTWLVRMWLFCVLYLPLVTAAKGSPQSLLSNLKAELCVLKVIFLKETFPMHNAGMYLVPCSFAVLCVLYSQSLTCFFVFCVLQAA